MYAQNNQSKVVELSFGGFPSLPPQNIEAEEAILGGILIDPNAMGRIVDTLRPEAFYIHQHREIYKAALALHGADRPCDLMMVTTWLYDHEMLERVGGQCKLADLCDRTVSAVNIDRYADMVMDKYHRRQLIQAGNEIVELGHEIASELEDVMGRAEQKIFSLSHSEVVAPAVEEPLDIMIRIYDQLNSPKLKGLPSDINDLDVLIGGFKRKKLYIVAGRSGMGKCLPGNIEIPLATGEVVTVSELYDRKQGSVLTLQRNWKLNTQEPSAFIDNGIKPVYRLTTKLGKVIESTANHPYLKLTGWTELADLRIGDRIAVPRILPVTGSQSLPSHKIKLLGYLLGDGGMSTASDVRFTNGNPIIMSDFKQCVSCFPVTKTVDSKSSTATPTAIVVKDLEAIQVNRLAFSVALNERLKNLGLSKTELALRAGVPPANLSRCFKGGSVPGLTVFERLCETLGLQGFIHNHLAVNSQNTVCQWLMDLGLMNVTAETKFIPRQIFTLPNLELAVFINRLFATDGWASLTTSKSGKLQAQVGYCSKSEKMVRQVQHLLLRFGIIAKISKRKIKYKDSVREAWQLCVTHAESIKTFADEIGIFGKEASLARVKEYVLSLNGNVNRDVVPIEAWGLIQQLKGNESWANLAVRSGLAAQARGVNLSVGKNGLSRKRLFSLATALESAELQSVATSDVYWDEVTNIEYLGERQTYDLTIPDTHNFVANDICVHNTQFAVNLAINVVKQKAPVVAFSAEMDRDEWMTRFMAWESGVDSKKIEEGTIESQEDYTRLADALGTLSDIPLYLDDTPGSALTPARIRSTIRRATLKYGKPGLVVLDYLQLLGDESGSGNRVTELDKIANGCKAIAKEFDVPFVALAQINRATESQSNKRPVISQLRESGAIEQAADVILMLYREDYYDPNASEKGVCEIIVGKQRGGPTGTVKAIFKPETSRFLNMAQPQWRD